MDFRCEALADHGVHLIPPSSPDYAPLLADIDRRSQPAEAPPFFLKKITPVISEQETATSAILVNHNSQAIAALQTVRVYETVTGQTYRQVQSLLSPQSLLLPFGRRKNVARLFGYWHTILPGSRRYLSESGMVGDNSDVRPPGSDEKRFGGAFALGRCRGRSSAWGPVRATTLILDGVFFIDGAFVGPNHQRLFEKTVADAEAHLLVARIARDSLNRGLTPSQVFAELEDVTGPAPDHPAISLRPSGGEATMDDFRRAALQRLALRFMIRVGFRKVASEEQTIRCIMAWEKTALPNFRRL